MGFFETIFFYQKEIIKIILLSLPVFVLADIYLCAFFIKNGITVNSQYFKLNTKYKYNV